MGKALGRCQLQVLHRSSDDSLLPAFQHSSLSLTELDLGAKLHAMRPSVKLILSSGNSEESISDEVQSLTNYNVVTNSSRMQVLLPTIRHLLD